MGANVLASVSVVLGAELSGFRAGMAQARQELRGLVQFSEGLRDVGKSLTTYVSAPLALLATGAVAAQAKVEALTKGLEAITTQELAQQGVTGLTAMDTAARLTGERIKELQQIAKQPGLGFEGAEQADIRLRAVGISAEQSAKSIQAFANAIATTGGGTDEFNRVTVQLAQLSAKGKVLAQDLRPIIEAAPAVAAALQRLYGTVDSETISGSLAKQGQTTRDFVGILTDELAKLPQVSGGLKAVYENDLDAILLASAKVGDGIAKAFNLQEVGEKLGDQITALGDGFANLPTGVQQTIVVLGGLVAAAGPAAVAVGTLGASLPYLKAGFTAVKSGVTLLSSGLVSLLNPTTAVVAGLALLAGAAYYAYTADERLLESYQELAAKTNELTKTVNPLLNRYDELTAKTSLTSQEQTELTDIIQKLAETVPSATTAIDAYGKVTAINANVTREYVQALQRQKEADAALNLPAQTQKLERLRLEYELLKKRADEFNRTGTLKQVSVESGDVATFNEYKAGSLAVRELQASLANANVEFLKQKQLVEGLKGSTDALVESDASLLNTLNSIGLNGGRTVGLLAELEEKLKAAKELKPDLVTESELASQNILIQNLEKQIKRLNELGIGSKKGTDAIAKLRRELASFETLAKIFPYDSVFQKTEEKVKLLENGLKTLLSAGISPASKAFKEFANLALTERQSIAKGLADQPIALALVPQVKVDRTIGDKLGADVARLIGPELANRPIDLPLRLNLQRTDFSKDLLEVSNALKVGSREFSQINALSLTFGENFNAAAARANYLEGKLQEMIANGIDPTSAAFRELAAAYKSTKREAESTAASLAANQAASQVLQRGIIDLATGITDSFGAALVGTQNFGDALGQTLLSTISTIAGELGQILLASGLGIEALKVSLKSFTGVGAIAAGLGLLAIAGIAKAQVSSLGSSGSAGSGGASGFGQAADYGQYSSQNIRITIDPITLRAAGADLVGISKQREYRQSRVD